MNKDYLAMMDEGELEAYAKVLASRPRLRRRLLTR